MTRAQTAASIPSGHTPGPWAIHAKQYGNQPIFVGQLEAGSRYTVAKVRSIRCAQEETFANAHLIAAAPTMLEALEKWLAYDAGDQENGVQLMLDYADALEATRASIALARGEKGA